jgi:hypothetical protein
MKAIRQVRGWLSGLWTYLLGLPRRALLLWVILAAILMIGPIALTLARAREFTASVEVFTQSQPYPVRDPMSYLEGLLDDPFLHQALRRPTRISGRSEWESELETVRLRPTRTRPSITMSASADTPRRVRDFVNILGTRLAETSARQVQQRSRGRATRLRRRLRNPELPANSRRLVRRDLARVERLLQENPAQIVLGPRPGAPRPKRWADRLVDELPGSFPTRPSPFVAGLAGLAVAVALGIILLLVRRREVTVTSATGPR